MVLSQSINWNSHLVCYLYYVGGKKANNIIVNLLFYRSEL